jgi:hypothetical protein
LRNNGFLKRCSESVRENNAAASKYARAQPEVIYEC